MDADSLCKTVLAHASVGIVVLEGDDFRVRYANPAAKALGGIAEGVEGAALADLLPKVRTDTLEVLRGVLETRESRTLHGVESQVVKRPDGGPTYWDIDCLPLDSEASVPAVTMIAQNVTEHVLLRRKAAAATAALVESEARFRAAQDLALNGFVLLRALRDSHGQVVDFDCVYGNPAALRMGRMTEADLRSKTLSQALRGFEATAAWRALLQVISTGAPVEMEFYYKGSGIDGWFQQSIVRVDDCVAVNFADITARKQTEQALALSEERLRLALASAPLALFNRDLDLCMTWAHSPRWKLLSDALIGTTLEELYVAEDAEKLRRFYAPVLQGGSANQLFHMRYSERFGYRDVWMELHAQPMRALDGTIIGVSTAAYEVSKLIGVQRTLEEREALLRLAIEAAQMGFWEYDRVSEEVRYSESLGRIFGLPAQQTQMPARRFQELVQPEDLEGLHEWSRRVIGEQTYFLHQFRARRLDGEMRWLEVRGQVIRDDAGDAQRLIGVTLDVTEENELRERLERSNRDLERFAATVAHDLKSPLQTMLGFGGLLARTAVHRLSEQEQAHLRHVLDAARQMNDLIDGVLDSARARQSYGKQPVNLEEAFAQCLLRLGATIRQVEPVITHQALPTVTGNRVLLTQALQNLLANAMKYRASRPLYIHVNAERRAGEWVIGVRDNGIGIAAEHQDRLFEAFTRAHDDESYPGLGLGLALVKSAVGHHGGRVWLESAVHEGSTFYFSIPD